MRMKLFLVLVGIAVMVYAAHMAYVVLTNRRPVRMTCAEFLNNRPGALWVELTDCELDLANAIGLQSRVLKLDKGLYVPVRPVGGWGPAAILVKANDLDPSADLTDEATAASPTTPTGDDSDRPVKTISGLVQST